MNIEDYHRAKNGVLWSLRHFGRDVVEPERRYFFPMTSRRPVGEVLFQYTLEGRVLHRDQFGEHEVPLNHAFICVYGEQSQYWRPVEWHEKYICEWVQLRGVGIAEYMNVLRRRFGSVVPFCKDSSLGEALQRILERKRVDGQLNDLWIDATIHDFVLKLFQQLEEEDLHHYTPVDRAIDLLLREPLVPWSLKVVAKQHGVTREHLTRVFHERVGQSPAKYLTQIRLQKAVDLLKETNLPLAHIAEQSGFSSQHTLARHIRTEFDQSPTQLRAQK